MEVLNRNQRLNAIWRIIGIAASMLAVLLVILFSTYKAYSAQGVAEANRMQTEHEKNKHEWQGNKQQLESDVKELKLKLKECMDNNGGRALETCQKKLEKKEENLERLEKELDVCESSLQILNS